jgi:predicted homoserine dehydrogenase-like protein
LGASRNYHRFWRPFHVAKLQRRLQISAAVALRLVDALLAARARRVTRPRDAR